MTSTRRVKAVAQGPTRLAIAPEGASGIACPECGGGLDLHQPDPDTPELLLAICEDCTLWCAIGVDEVRGEAIVLPIPGVALLRASLGSGAEESSLDAVAGCGTRRPDYCRFVFFWGLPLGEGRAPSGPRFGVRSHSGAWGSWRAVAKAGRTGPRGRRGPGPVPGDPRPPAPPGPRSGPPADNDGPSGDRPGCASPPRDSNSRRRRLVTCTRPSAGNSTSRQKKPKSSTPMTTAWNASPILPSRCVSSLTWMSSRSAASARRSVRVQCSASTTSSSGSDFGALPSRIAAELAVDLEVGIAADRRGEVAVILAGQGVMPLGLGGVVRLLEAAQEGVMDGVGLGPLGRLGQDALELEAALGRVDRDPKAAGELAELAELARLGVGVDPAGGIRRASRSRNEATASLAASMKSSMTWWLWSLRRQVGADDLAPGRPARPRPRACSARGRRWRTAACGGSSPARASRRASRGPRGRSSGSAGRVGHHGERLLVGEPAIDLDGRAGEAAVGADAILVELHQDAHA